MKMKVKKIEEEYPFIQYCWFADRTVRLKGEIIYIKGVIPQELKVQDCIFHNCPNYKTGKCLIGRNLQGVWVKE